MADAKSAQKPLFRALKDGRFDPLYYFHGGDEFLKESAVRDVVRVATDPATRDFNLEIRRGGEVDAATLTDLLGTPPMMADRRVVILRDVSALKKDARTALDRYLISPSADLVVVLVAPAGVKPDKALESATVAIPFEPLSGDRVPKWIAHHAREVLKTSIEPRAAEQLQAAAGDDLQQLAAELEKLAAFVLQRATDGGSAVIDEKAIEAVVGVQRGETTGDFLDRLAERDATGALALVEHVLQLPKTGAVPLVMMMGAQTLAIGWARAALAGGMSPSGLVNGLMDLFKVKGVMLGRGWLDAAKAASRAATSGKWTDAAIDDALEALLIADALLKETGVSTDEQVITDLVFAMCARTSPRQAA